MSNPDQKALELERKQDLLKNLLKDQGNLRVIIKHLIEEIETLSKDLDINSKYFRG